jgi:hypothetical protein
LLYQPGEKADKLWHPSTSSNFSSSAISAQAYDFPISGRFVGEKWQTIWYRATSTTSPVWTWSGEHVRATSTTENSDLGTGLTYVPLVGNFLSEAVETGVDDIAWYAPLAEDIGERLVIWDTLPAQLSNRYSFVSGVPGESKVVAGNFDSNELSTELLFYAQSESGAHQVWTFDLPDGADINFTVPLLSEDSSPVVGDFNGDHCDDILWFTPHFDASPVWRSDCEGGFVDEVPVEHPTGAYPVGYGIGYARAQ